MFRKLLDCLTRRIRYAQIMRSRRNARLDAAFYASLQPPPARPAAAPAKRRRAA